ncbi:MAG: OstA-like protein, partial [Bacteroidota bacterium]
MIRINWTTVMFVAAGGILSGQVPSLDRGSNDSDSITYLTTIADEVSYYTDGTTEWDTLWGRVQLIQDSLYMFCDRAVVEDKTFAEAYEEVVIIHRDSIQIFSDTLLYDGAEETAILTSRVILQEGERNVYTQELEYYIPSREAIYRSGGTLTQRDQVVTSQYGYYNTITKTAELSGNVDYRDTSMTVYTDSIVYYTDADQINLVSPSRISRDSVEIYAQSGVIRMKIEQGVLSGDVQVKTQNELITSGILSFDGIKNSYQFWVQPKAILSDGIATADTMIYYRDEDVVELIGHASYVGNQDVVDAPFIRYNLSTEDYATKGRANIHSGDTDISANDVFIDDSGATVLQGQVSIREDSGKTNIYSDYAISHDQGTQIYSVNGQPLMQYVLTEDTLSIRADTLLQRDSTITEQDTIGEFYRALNDVTLYSGNVSGRADLFDYSISDSMIIMIGSPVLWSDSIQLSADTITLYISGGSVKRIDQSSNAFILSPDEQGNLNQIKCKHISNRISDGKIDSTFAERNVELCFLVMKDGEYEAVNRTTSSSMVFTFDNADIESVRMDGNQESNIYTYTL